MGLSAALLFSAGGALHSSKTEGEIRSGQRDLEKIQRELSRKTTERANAARKSRELAEEVERISRELQSSQRSLKETQARLREAERNRKSAEERLWTSRLSLGQWGDMLNRELQRYYERRVTAEAGRFMEMAYRRAALEDKATGLKFARQHHAEVEGLRDQLLSFEVELQKLRLRREREEERVASAQKQMRSMHQTVEGRRAVLENQIKELRASAEKLESFVLSLIEQKRAEDKAAAEAAAKAAKTAKAKKPVRPAAKAPPAMVSQRKKGRLPWPVEGKVLERYGRSKHPELDTYVFSNGIKLKPAAAGGVRAVEKGEVLYAGEFMSYGLMALIRHSDDLHSIYAHLGRLNVARGQQVSVGQDVGTPGLDEKGQPAVYFELRVSGAAVDPLLWLQ